MERIFWRKSRRPNLKIGDIVEHERGYTGRVSDVNYCDPNYYVQTLRYGSAEAYEICDEVEVEWWGEANGKASPRTSVKFLKLLTVVGNDIEE